MQKPDFEQKFNELSAKMLEISKMINVMDQMKEYLKLPSFLKDIWDDGYRQGVKYGKKAAINIKKN